MDSDEDIEQERPAEAALHDSAERFQTLADTVPGMIWTARPDGSNDYANRHWYDYTGLTPEQSLGYGWTVAVHPEDLPGSLALWRRHLETGEPGEAEVRLRRRDGTYRWFLLRMVPRRDEKNQLLEWVGTFTDITAIKQAEQALRESAERYRLISALTSDCTYVLRADRDGTVAVDSVSQGFTQVIGYTLEELNERGGWAGTVYPDDLPTARQSLEKLLVGQPDTNELRHLTKAGEVRWMRHLVRPVWDEAHGRVIHVYGAMQDITEAKKAQQVLEESERRFRTLARYAPVGIFLSDAEGNCLFVNEKWCALAGMSPELAQGRGWADALHPDDRERILHGWSRAVRMGEASAEEFRFRTPQGRVSWVQGLAVPLRSDRGELVGYIGTVMDITQRRQAEEALRRSQERLDLAQQAAGIGTFEWIITSGEVTWTEAEKRLYGLVSGGFGGRYEDWQQAVHPDDRGRAEADLLRAVRDQTALDTAFRVVWPDGSVRWLAAKGRVFYGEHGEPVRMLGVNLDITDSKRAAEALRESEQRFRQLAEGISEVFWMSDLQAHGVLYVSPAYEKVWGRSCQSLYEQPRSFLDAVYPEDRERVLAALDRHHRGEPSDTEYRVVRPDGSVRWVRDRGFPVQDAAGRVYRFAGIAEDITERRCAEEQRRLLEEQLRWQNRELAAADRHKDEFLAMLAHELRNPLAPIRNALHLWKEPTASEEILDRVRAMAERQVQQMARLLDDLLDVSRISRGKIELRKEALDVTAAVKRSAEAVRSLVEDRHHRLSLALPPESLRVEADSTRLEQILTNLLTNACRYSDPGGHIDLTAGREGSQVVLRVRDDGIGIAPDMLPCIFDLFVQAERQPDRSRGGVGIGLTLVRRLVELHGGTVEAHSEGLGRGSEFVVRLPALANEPVSEPIEREGDPVPSPTAPLRRVLVVDDNRDAADSLALSLKLMGQEVQVAYDGPTALVIAQVFCPQVVLLDIGMPGMSGYEVASRLRRQDGLESVLLVALTGWGQDEDRRRSREAGFDHHLVKPVDPEAIHALLADASMLAAR